MSNLKQLSKSLGLSITTVSRALNGYSDVSEATRKRVQAAAEKAGYQPNASARRLRRKCAELVAIPLPSKLGQIGPPHFVAMLADCADHLAAAGLNLVIAPVPSGQSELEMCRRFVDGQRVDAMLLVRTKRHDERVEFLQARGIPFVTHGRTESSLPHPFIDGDGQTAFYDATCRFIRDGHTAIGHLAGPDIYTFSHVRRMGWEAALAAHGLRSDLVVSGDLSEHGGYTAAQALMAGKTRPSAIVCVTDDMAIGALRALREIDGGDRVSIVGHDNWPTGAYTHPMLSTMQMSGADFGERLASLLLRAIANEPPETLQELYPVTFIERESHRRFDRS